MKKTLLVISVVQLLALGVVRAETPAGGVDPALKKIEEIGTVLREQHQSRQEMEGSLLALGWEWIRAGNAILADANHPLRRQIVVASEIPHPVLMVGDTEQVVIEGGPHAKIRLIKHGKKTTQDFEDADITTVQENLMNRTRPRR